MQHIPPPWERPEASPLPTHLSPQDPARDHHDPLVDATGLIGRSPEMARLRALTARFAQTSATALILGETGTGKELVARALHTLGPRAKGPFVAVNVAALPESTLQSELFGHERGAFTGAHARHRGLFQQAHGGTLFLDEIGETTPDVQASLLRAIELGEVRAVGSESAQHVNVRLIAATHRDLAALVAHRDFRADLYFRLHTLPLHVAPLRLRVEDIPALVTHILSGFALEAGARAISPRALRDLMAYGWPGNVRQLRSVLQRASVLSPGPELDAEAIQAALSVEPPTPRLASDAGVAATIEFALKASGGKIAAAARKLGVPRSTLRSHMKRFGIVFARTD